jgi:hypothetical protein
MTLEELKGLVPEDGHTDFDTLIAEITTHDDPLKGITNEGFTELLGGNEDLRKVVDTRTSKGLETWQKNNLDKLYQDRYAKENPDESESDKRIKALEIKADEADRRAFVAEERSKGQRQFTEKHIPLDMVPLAIGTDQETTTANFATIEKAFADFLQSSKDGWLKANSRTPPNGPPDDGDKYYTAEQLDQMSDQEQEENWTKVQASLSMIGSRE